MGVFIIVLWVILVSFLGSEDIRSKLEYSKSPIRTIIVNLLWWTIIIIVGNIKIIELLRVKGLQSFVKESPML